MLKMVDGTGIIGVDMICPLGVSTPQPPNYDKVELEGTGVLVLPNSLDAPLERLELGGKTEQVQTSGKNLANPSEFVIGTIAGDTGNIINLKQYIATGYIPVIPGKRYSTSCGNKFLAHTITAYDKEKTKINYPMNMSSEMPEGAAYIRLSYKKIDMANVTESDMEELKKVCMVNEGSTVLPYEPYTGGKPSPSPEYPQEIKNSGKWNEEKQKYKVDVKVTGKNLFNREKAKDVSNWISIEGDGYLKFPIRAKKGSMITFSYTEKLTEGKKFYLGIAKKETGSVIAWLYHDTNLSVSNSKYTIVSEEGYVYLMCNKSAIQSFLDAIQTLQVEISPTQTNYEPYKEQSLTLTSDRPITKWDRLVEQGGEIGWLYKSKIDALPKTGYRYIETGYFSKGNVFTDSALNSTVTPGSQFFTCFSLANPSSKKGDIAWLYVNKPGTTDLRVRFADESINTIELFEKYMADKDIKILYETAQTEFVPLPQSEQNAIRALKTYYPTTVITVDGGEVDPDIKVTYRKEI